MSFIRTKASHSILEKLCLTIIKKIYVKFHLQSKIEKVQCFQLTQRLNFEFIVQDEQNPASFAGENLKIKIEACRGSHKVKVLQQVSLQNQFSISFSFSYGTKASEKSDVKDEPRNRAAMLELRQSWGASGNPMFDVSKMRHLLDHDNHEMRDSFRQFMTQPLFQPRFDLTLEEEVQDI